ncbi:MAG TPA: hypothetical protein VJS44_12720 [Pyrinomonadaceae bacterium]|nr:hypothetical protein [Pyrinomonadaceae bacterium]
MKDCNKSKLLKEGLLGASVAGVTALAAYLYLIRPWHLTWGATPEETTGDLPGDELVPNPKAVATHAITIDAPVMYVWSWLVQMGQDKGGFYSYTWLENIVGCHMRNAERIVPEFQRLHEGDTVRLHPKAPPLPVKICEPFKAIVMGSNTQNPGTWGFYLKEIDENTTRLIVRGRGDWLEPSWLNWLMNYVVFEPTHFIMERKMLLGIKERAERASYEIQAEAA